MDVKRDDPEAGEPVITRMAADMRIMRPMLIGLFIFASVYALYFAREFFMPVILAFLLALMLTPLVRWLRRRGVPEPLSATFLVFLTVCAITMAGYAMSGPVIDLANSGPRISQQIADKFEPLRRPLERLMAISSQVEKVADPAQEPGIQKVVVAQPGIISQAAGNLLSAGTSITITFVLSLFLLASGSMFYEKLVQSFARMSEKKRALRVVYDVEREISRYLLTVTVINIGLGVAVAAGMWAIGMPTPILWGMAAALLNFLPYIGAATSIVLVAAISVITFESLTYALVAPLYVFICDVIEGQVITPLVVGRRLEINAVSIFIAVAFWSWLWGFMGALIAVPILVVIKVFCDNFEGLRHVGNFLSAQQSADEPEPEEPASQKT